MVLLINASFKLMVSKDGTGAIYFPLLHFLINRFDQPKKKMKKKGNLDYQTPCVCVCVIFVWSVIIVKHWLSLNFQIKSIDV